ncbi:MAG: hypothetical protein Q9180_000763 [Flavoplaca navasiana]
MTTNKNHEKEEYHAGDMYRLQLEPGVGRDLLVDAIKLIEAANGRVVYEHRTTNSIEYARLPAANPDEFATDEKYVGKSKSTWLDKISKDNWVDEEDA